MDSRTVNEAYEAYRLPLQAYLSSLTNDRESAEDLVQEAYSRLLVEIRAGRAPNQPRAWLYQVGHNLAISRGRRLQVAQRTSARLYMPAVEASAEEHVVARENGARLQALLAKLDPADRSALLMAAEGYSGAEIARALGRSLSCVRTRMCRARMRLRERLLAGEEQPLLEAAG